MTYEEFRTLKANHDHAVELGASCPADCVLRAPVYVPVEDYTPPDPYGPSISTLRAACATPESTFEERWKAERLAELNAEHERFAAGSEERHAEHLRDLEEAISYAPAPDPYAEPLRLLRAKEQR